MGLGPETPRFPQGFTLWVESVVTFVVGLICLVKRKQALRGRNLSRDSRAEGAPRVHRASGMRGETEAGSAGTQPV